MAAQAGVDAVTAASRRGAGAAAADATSAASQVVHTGFALVVDRIDYVIMVPLVYVSHPGAARRDRLEDRGDHAVTASSVPAAPVPGAARGPASRPSGTHSPCPRCGSTSPCSGCFS